MVLMISSAAEHVFVVTFAILAIESLLDYLIVTIKNMGNGTTGSINATIVEGIHDRKAMG